MEEQLDCEESLDMKCRAPLCGELEKMLKKAVRFHGRLTETHLFNRQLFNIYCM